MKTKTQTYIFVGIADRGDNELNETTVQAITEERARELAMTKRWGPSGDRIVPGTYTGRGLTLKSVDGALTSTTTSAEKAA